MTYKLKFINLVNLLSINSRQKWASLVALMVKNHLRCQETWIQSLGREDSLDQGMATHSIILAWRIPRTEEPGVLQFMGFQRVQHD